MEALRFTSLQLMDLRCNMYVELRRDRLHIRQQLSFFVQANYQSVRPYKECVGALFVVAKHFDLNLHIEVQCTCLNQLNELTANAIKSFTNFQILHFRASPNQPV